MSEYCQQTDEQDEKFNFKLINVEISMVSKCSEKSGEQAIALLNECLQS